MIPKSRGVLGRIPVPPGARDDDEAFFAVEIEARERVHFQHPSGKSMLARVGGNFFCNSLGCARLASKQNEERLRRCGSDRSGVFRATVGVGK